MSKRRQEADRVRGCRGASRAATVKLTHSAGVLMFAMTRRACRDAAAASSPRAQSPAPRPQAIFDSAVARFPARPARGVGREVRRAGAARARRRAAAVAARHRSLLRRPLRGLPAAVRVAPHRQSRTMWRTRRGISSASRAPIAAGGPRRAAAGRPRPRRADARGLPDVPRQPDAGRGDGRRRRSSGGQFYAHLYVGLYYEATGDQARALEHIAAAADSRATPLGRIHACRRAVHLSRLHDRVRMPDGPAKAGRSPRSIAAGAWPRLHPAYDRPSLVLADSSPGIRCRRGLAGVPRADRPGTFERARPAARVERVAQRHLEDAGPGRGWSSPVVAGGRVWLTTAIERNAAVRCALLAFDAETGRELVNAEVFRPRQRRLAQSRRTASRRRRRSSTAIASTCTSAPTAPRR